MVCILRMICSDLRFHRMSELSKFYGKLPLH